MAFDDFLTSIGNLFGGGGGDSGGIPTGSFPAAASSIMDPNTTGANQQGGANPLISLILGVGAPLLTKLMGDPTAGALKNLNKGSNVGTDIGTKLLKRASQGKLTDPQQASVDAMKKEQMARWGQYLAGLGIPVSTAMVQGQNEVDLKAQKLANDLINESFQQGISALNMAQGQAGPLLTAAMAEKKDMAQTIAEVAKQMGLILNSPQGTPGLPGGVMNANANIPAEWQPDPNYSYFDHWFE